MLKLKTVSLLKHRSDLSILPEGKLLINTINAHSYNTALKDAEFAEALLKGGALIPDGASMVLAFRWLRKESIERTAGWDLFEYEMERLNRKGGICYFLGSSKNTLKLIKEKAKTVYPNIRIETYSPPYKPEFTEEENQMMIDAINAVKPDLLWIGMTAPKQEKWAYMHLDALEVNGHIGTIGAVFDFFAGTVERAPVRWQEHGLEWLYRLIKEPRLHVAPVYHREYLVPVEHHQRKILYITSINEAKKSSINGLCNDDNIRNQGTVYHGDNRNDEHSDRRDATDRYLHDRR